MAKFIKDGFACISIKLLDIRLKLDDQGEQSCREAYDAMCRMNPNEWDLSYTLRKGDNMNTDVSLTSSYGQITFRSVPVERIINDIHFGYWMAQFAIRTVNYDNIF